MLGFLRLFSNNRRLRNPPAYFCLSVIWFPGPFIFASATRFFYFLCFLLSYCTVPWASKSRLDSGIPFASHNNTLTREISLLGIDQRPFKTHVVSWLYKWPLIMHHHLTKKFLSSAIPFARLTNRNKDIAFYRSPYQNLWHSSYMYMYIFAYKMNSMTRLWWPWLACNYPMAISPWHIQLTNLEALWYPRSTQRNISKSYLIA